MPTRRTAFRIPPETLADIDDRAAGDGMTRTAWVLDAVRRKAAWEDGYAFEYLLTDPDAE